MWKIILTYMNVHFEPMKYLLRQDSYLTNNIQNITIIINIIIDNDKHEENDISFHNKK